MAGWEAGLGQEAGAGIYDALHESVESDGGARARAIYAPLFRAMLGLVAASGATSVLEVGCGSGLFAELLLRDAAIAYRGFDFSPAGVALARARVKRGEFFVGNALSAESYRGEYGCIVCAEVLEHIHDDLDAVALWPSGTASRAACRTSTIPPTSGTFEARRRCASGTGRRSTSTASAGSPPRALPGGACANPSSA